MKVYCLDCGELMEFEEHTPLIKGCSGCKTVWSLEMGFEDSKRLIILKELGLLTEYLKVGERKRLCARADGLCQSPGYLK